MKKSLTTLATGLALMSLSACANVSYTTNSSASTTVPNKTSWELTEPVVNGRAPNITFDNGGISGFSGCNRYSGAQGSPKTGYKSIISTRMACVDEFSQIEQAFLNLLSNPFEVQTKADRLTLSAQGKRYVFKPLTNP
ncbi:MAG: META domain-containing protein [Neisseriaceae bacterium]|nr:META domain-containing protein [Neisseriaceae bacterium]